MNRNSYYGRTSLFLAVFLLYMPSAQAENIAITDFAQNTLSGWQIKTFKGETRYTLNQPPSHPCIRAESHASASGLYKKIHIDLKKTPYLYWRWNIAHPLNNPHEREKRGDDFAARVYIIVSGGLFFWNTKAINYVWADREPVGAAWHNPYTSNAIMLAVESGAAHAGQWRQYRRNVRQDLKKLFGQDIDHIDAIAIMTDTDNTGQQASACYGNISFRAD